MNLSPHFDLSEFISPNDKGKPSQIVVDNLQHLCLKVLEPLRKKKGGPIRITSGWRSYWYNLRVGGAVNGQHPKGTAADVEAISLEEQLQAIAYASTLPDVGGLGFYPGRGFYHIYTRPRKRGFITTWMRDHRKRYVALPPHIHQALIDRGAKNLI